MMVDNIQIRRALDSDLDSACDLVKENYVGNLTDAQKQDGFLSICFTRDELKAMADDGVMIVAVLDSKVVGFLCTQTCQYNREHIPIAKTMIDMLSDGIDDQRTLVCGPVCVGSLARGQGLFERMYAFLAEQIHGVYDSGITFVSESNPRSIAAHRDKMGMAPAGVFEHGGKTFQALRHQFVKGHS